MVYGEESYWIAKFIFQRGIALVYFTAFLIAFRQVKGLLGEKGILPVREFVEDKEFGEVVSLFYFFPKGMHIRFFTGLGLLISVLSFLGIPDILGTWAYVAAWGLMWAIFLSLKNVGQKFYLSGNALLEAGFLAIFLGPFTFTAPIIMILLLRWFLFRMIFGSGLCKVKSGGEWLNLNSLDHFFETQGSPNPLSWYFHNLPGSLKKIGVLFTHFNLLILPFLLFMPQPVAGIAGLTAIGMQILLILSGNFYWLNLITITAATTTLSDSFWIQLTGISTPEFVSAYSYPSLPLILAGLIGILSLKPVYYMLTSEKFPSSSYSMLRIVNTYGRYPTVPEERKEIIIKGFSDGKWKEYRFKQKPDATDRRPPQVAPYNHKLDDVLWLAAHEPEENRWIENLGERLLENEDAVVDLLTEAPFKSSPEKIRISLYNYRFTTPEERSETGDWWRRERVETLFEIER